MVMISDLNHHRYLHYTDVIMIDVQVRDFKPTAQ